MNRHLQTGSRRPRKPQTAVVYFWFLLIVASACLANDEGRSGDRNKLAYDVATQSDNVLVNVIVQFKQMPSRGQLSRMSGQGIQVQSTLPGINAALVQVDESGLENLQANGNVVYITPDRPIQGSVASENYLPAVMADVAAEKYPLNGTGIGVALIDSGVSDHPDLHYGHGSRVVYSQSFVQGDRSTADAYGHGTHVAGIIAGNGSASNGNGYARKIAGIAPNANIVNLRVLDRNGSGTDSQVISAILAAIQLKSKYNIRIINLSLGRQVFESYTFDPLCQAVEQAWKSGIVVVVAAGNDGRDNSHGTFGYATIASPANDPAVITVGATRTLYTNARTDDSIVSYSSKGPTLLDHVVKPDLVAPGNRIASLLVKGSTLDKQYPQLEVGPTSCKSMCSTSYFRLSGTSMATPVVSGAVALMLQQHAKLTPDMVKARLMKTAWKGFGIYSRSFDNSQNEFDEQYDVFSYGAGYLDVYAALSNNDIANGAALSPTAVLDPNSGRVLIQNTILPVFGNSVVWGSSVVWSNIAIWGNTIDANSVVWGATVVWGNSLDQGFSVVWGTSVVWGASISDFSISQDGEN